MINYHFVPLNVHHVINSISTPPLAFKLIWRSWCLLRWDAPNSHASAARLEIDALLVLSWAMLGPRVLYWTRVCFRAWVCYSLPISAAWSYLQLNCVQHHVCEAWHNEELDCDDNERVHRCPLILENLSSILTWYGATLVCLVERR